MPYSISMFKRYVLVYEFTMSYTIFMMLFSHYISRKLSRVRNPVVTTTGFGKISEPVSFLLVSYCLYGFKLHCHPLDTNIQGLLHGHFLVLFLGTGNNGDVLN